jgi:hypothetical protein
LDEKINDESKNAGVKKIKELKKIKSDMMRV